MSLHQLPSQISQIPSSSDDEVNLSELFSMLFTHKWKILCVTFLFSIFGTIYAYFSVPEYKIEAQLYVESEKQPLLSVKVSDGMKIINVPNLSLNKEMQILQSPQIQELLIKKLNLLEVFRLENADVTYEGVVDWLKENLKVTTNKKHQSIISISLQSSNIALSSNIINTLIDFYIENQEQRGVDLMQITLDVLGKKDSISKDELNKKASNRLKVFSYAKASLHPIKPKKALIIILSMFTGAILSVVVAFFTEILNAKIKNEHDITHLGLTVLASLPKNDKNNKTRMIDALRFLRINVQSRLLNQDEQIVMISPTGGNERKDSVCENLAVLEAKIGRKVLLIDADMRNDNFESTFTYEGDSTSLAHMLKSEHFNINMVGKNYTNIENLDFIRAGESIQNPAELLTKISWMQLLEWAKKEYDMVIINAPVASKYADAIIISEFTNINLLVVCANQTTFKEIKNEVKQFNLVGALVDGIVFNGAKS